MQANLNISFSKVICYVSLELNLSASSKERRLPTWTAWLVLEMKEMIDWQTLPWRRIEKSMIQQRLVIQVSLETLQDKNMHISG